MGKALYRKYRPRDFSEAVGQEVVTETLEKAVKTGRISHAYLFAGPRGVGKTSIARIMAHKINQLAYKDDASHLDIIEIDAASNRRIDEIRDLREKVRVTPVAAKYKVYIIDEVHMLTKEAFNALLKTLEEPPPHCVFILATTEAHKMPETIISRTQRFNFRPINQEAAQQYLGRIVKSENIDISQEAISLLAEHGDGSLRDVIGMLEQVSAVGKAVSTDEIRQKLGVPPADTMTKIIDGITTGDVQIALSGLDDLRETGVSPAQAAKSLSKLIREQYIRGGIKGGWAVKLLHSLLEVAASGQPQESLELAVLEAASQAETGSGNPPPDDPPAKPSSKNPPPGKNKADLPPPSQNLDLTNWTSVLQRVKNEAPSLYTALRLAEPSLDDGRLVLSFGFPLHQKKVKEAKHLQIISRVIEEVGGQSWPIDCIVDKTVLKTAVETDSPQVDSREDFHTISNIFGSAEVLES